MKLFKWLVKYFFYPVAIIANPRYNLLCFIAFIISYVLMPEPYSIVYICVFLLYMIAGQNLPSKWLREFYNIENW